MPGRHSMKTSLQRLLAQTDWPLLLFLACAVNVKLYVKLAGIAAYGGWLLWKKVCWQRPPAAAWFYALMPVLGIAVAAAHGSFGHHGYSLGATLGAVQWLAGGAILYLLYLTARQKSFEVLLATAKAFFALNALISLVQFGGLIVEAHHPFPYWYYDTGLKYGASTGDRLTGLCFNNSLNNAGISLMGLLLFAYRGRLGWAALCLLILMMCTSNVVTFGLMLLLVLMVIFGGRKGLRLDALKLLLLTIVIYPLLSPQNFLYIRGIVGRLTQKSQPFIAAERPDADSLLVDTSGALHQPLRSMSLHVSDRMLRSMPERFIALRHMSDTMEKPGWSYLVLEPAALRPAFEQWYGVPPEHTLLAHYGKPAKMFAIRQTATYLNESPTHWLFGAGMGNFSSKLAIKMTGLRLQGGFPEKSIYISRPYMEYHFYTLMYVLSRDVQEHSVINMPGSTYLQIAGEYGLVGLLLFALLYLRWFWMKSGRFKAGRWLLLALLGLLWLDYWFEMMTLTVVMEFILLSGIFARPSADAD